MSDWTNIAVPVITLILGSALTMAGQALRDRRAADREQRSLRAEFLSANFEVHRAAILEMQEIVRDSYSAFVTEKHRRSETGFYKFFDDFPFRNFGVEFTAIQASQEELDRLTKDESLTKSEKTKMANGIAKRILERAESVHNQSAKSLHDLQVQLEGIYPFWDDFKGVMARLRLRMMRSGSNSVVTSGEEYITNVFKWSEQFGSGERLEELSQQVLECRRNLDQVLANVLKYGPYNKSDKTKDKP